MCICMRVRERSKVDGLVLPVLSQLRVYASLLLATRSKWRFSACKAWKLL